MSEPGRGRRVVFLLFIVAILLVLAEAGSFVVSCVLRGKLVSPAQIEKERDAVRRLTRRATRADAAKPGETMATFLKMEVLHPYLGFVVDRKSRPRSQVEAQGLEVSEYGLFSDGEYLRPADPDRVVVGIFGGSVAFWFSLQGSEHLADELRKDPRYAGKEFDFVRVAWGGYKQPQQLIGLNYFLTLGAHFDMVVCIDGFNEVALSYNENLEHGVAEIFPRSWPWRIVDTPDPEVRRLMGLAVYTNDRRRTLANRFSMKPLSLSYSANLVWKVLDGMAARKVTRVEELLREKQKPAAGEGLPFAASGPYRQPVDQADALQRIVGQWRRASMQMHHLCAANAIPYFQFLQPNQYVPGSKPMRAEEKALAYNENHKHRDAVLKGYPLLIETGAELLAAGVVFRDLTGMFAEVEDPVYVDDCCHMGELGNKMMAERIAETILSVE